MRQHRDVTLLPLCPCRWIDKTPDPVPETYTHWGVSVPDGTPEPNNMYPPESCSTANFTQSYQQAWGWADLGCYNNVSIMCKIKCGCQSPACAAGSSADSRMHK